MNPTNYLDNIQKLQAAQQAFYDAVVAEALPAMRAAWEADPCRVQGGPQMVRVDRVVRRVATGKVPGVWHEIWQAAVAWKPATDSSLILRFDPEKSAWDLVDGAIPVTTYGYNMMPPDAGQGVIWLCEPGAHGMGAPSHPFITTCCQGPDDDPYNSPLETVVAPVLSEEDIRNNVVNLAPIYVAARTWLGIREQSASAPHFPQH
jgi:hypothetical protein